MRVAGKVITPEFARLEQDAGNFLMYQSVDFAALLVTIG